MLASQSCYKDLKNVIEGLTEKSVDFGIKLDRLELNSFAWA